MVSRLAVVAAALLVPDEVAARCFVLEHAVAAAGALLVLVSDEVAARCFVLERAVEAVGVPLAPDGV